MRILVWYVHGGWMNAFTRIGHELIVPDEQTPPGVAGVTRVPEAELANTAVDVVVLQRTGELTEAERLLGRRPGRDVPAIFVEHNTPQQSPVGQVHFLAEQAAIAVVHVTHFNALVWDTGRAPTRVIEHGVPDPGALYTGELTSLGVVVNEPIRRGRVVGTDLLPRFAECAPLDVFGIGTDLLPDAFDAPIRSCGDLPTSRLHAEMARRRVYLHPFRWTSLGLSLIEAMSLAMPVVALATTEAPRAVPPEAGAISTNIDELVAAAKVLLRDPERARVQGAAARQFAQARYGMERFARDWGEMLADARRAPSSPTGHLPGTPLKGRIR